MEPIPRISIIYAAHDTAADFDAIRESLNRAGRNKTRLFVYECGGFVLPSEFQSALRPLGTALSEGRGIPEPPLELTFKVAEHLRTNRARADSELQLLHTGQCPDKLLGAGDEKIPGYAFSHALLQYLASARASAVSEDLSVVSWWLHQLADLLHQPLNAALDSGNVDRYLTLQKTYVDLTATALVQRDDDLVRQLGGLLTARDAQGHIIVVRGAGHAVSLEAALQKANVVFQAFLRPSDKDLMPRDVVINRRIEPHDIDKPLADHDKLLLMRDPIAVGLTKLLERKLAQQNRTMTSIDQHRCIMEVLDRWGDVDVRQYCTLGAGDQRALHVFSWVLRNCTEAEKGLFM